MKTDPLCLVCFALFILLGKNAAAQDYQSAIGLKFGGYENGIAGKYFNSSTTALEGELGFRQHGVVVTGLYELYVNGAFNVPELKFYYGLGAHVGAVGKGEYQDFSGSDQDYHTGHVLIGADGVAGLEYLIPKSPIALSLDLNPRVELASGPFFDVAPALGIKYFF